MRVLLVEDDQGVREGLEDLVAEYAEVRATASVSAALELLAAEPFDLVMADLRIGGDAAGGRRILVAARRLSTHAVIISASPRQEVADSLGSVPADEIIEKPFHLEEVTSVLERVKRERVSAP